VTSSNIDCDLNKQIVYLTVILFWILKKEKEGTLKNCIIIRIFSCVFAKKKCLLFPRNEERFLIK